MTSTFRSDNRPQTTQGKYRLQRIGSIRFISSNPEQACAQVLWAANQRDGVHVHLANAYTIALADESADYRRTLATPALIYPDGKPLGWVSILRGHKPRLRQVRGPQLFLDVFDHGRATGTKHYLLGSTLEVLERLIENLTRTYPGVEIVGFASPPFRQMTVQELEVQDAHILASGANIVWVGLGTPKQDFEAKRIADALPIMAVAIGAAFAFAAGTLRPAPVILRNLGLEWAFRLICEPRRLWRRYLFGNLRFLRVVLFKNKNSRESEKGSGDL